MIAALQIYQIICCNLQYVDLFLLILLRDLHGGAVLSVQRSADDRVDTTAQHSDVRVS